MNYQEIATTDTAFLLEHLIKFEIFYNLPMLDDNENKVKENVIGNASLQYKDKIKDFYQFIKKKYINFPQLAYFDDEVLHELYTYQNEYEKRRADFITCCELDKLLFEFYTQHKKAYFGEFTRQLRNKLDELNKETCLISDDAVWNNLLYNERMVNLLTNNPILVELLKYNPDFSFPRVLIEVDVIYPNLAYDLFSHLNNIKELTHLVVKFSGMKGFNRGLVYTYNNDENYHEEANKIIKVILTTTMNSSSLSVLVLTSPNQPLKLNKANSNLLVSLLIEKFPSVFVLNQVIVNEEMTEGFIKAIYNNQKLKFVHLNGLNFDNSSNLLSLFTEKYKETSDYVYIRLDKDNYIDNIS